MRARVTGDGVRNTRHHRGRARNLSRMGTPHDRTVYDSGGWDTSEGGDMTAPSRQPAGTPTGGQFAPDSRREADTRLANTPVPDGSYRHPPRFDSADQIAAFWNRVEIPDQVLDKLDAYYQKTTGTYPAAKIQFAIDVQMDKEGKGHRSYWADYDADYDALFREYRDLIVRNLGEYTTEHEDFTYVPDIPVVRSKPVHKERKDKQYQQTKADRDRIRPLSVEMFWCRDRIYYRMAEEQMAADGISYPERIHPNDLRPAARVVHMLDAVEHFAPPETGPEGDLRKQREQEHLRDLPVAGSRGTVGGLEHRYDLEGHYEYDIRPDPEPAEPGRQQEQQQLQAELQNMRQQLADAQQQAADQAAYNADMQQNLYAQQQNMARQAEQEAKQRKRDESAARWERRADRWRNR